MLLGILVGVCFLASGLAVPLAAHLPTWIEFEMVLGIWWVVWWIVLAFLLYNRYEIEDDAPVPEADRLRRIPWGEAGEGFFWGSGCAVSEGCMVAVVVAFLLGVLALGVLFVIELVIPAIAFILCLGVRGMLAQAARRHAVCEGNAALSLLWATVWATVYTAPIGLIIWGVQSLLSHRQG